MNFLKLSAVNNNFQKMIGMMTGNLHQQGQALTVNLWKTGAIQSNQRRMMPVIQQHGVTMSWNGLNKLTSECNPPSHLWMNRDTHPQQTRHLHQNGHHLHHHHPQRGFHQGPRPFSKGNADHKPSLAHFGGTGGNNEAGWTSRTAMHLKSPPSKRILKSTNPLMTTNLMKASMSRTWTKKSRTLMTQMTFRTSKTSERECSMAQENIE
jgi:hypothetical protein